MWIETEEEGFEPPVRCRTAVFKTAALSRSATLPAVNSLFNLQLYYGHCKQLFTF